MRSCPRALPPSLPSLPWSDCCARGGIQRTSSGRGTTMAATAAGAGQAPRTRSSVTRQGGSERKNVNDIERMLSVAAGGALAAYALKKRDLGGLLVALVGGALV